MDCDEILFSEPVPSFLDCDPEFHDMYLGLSSWDGANLVEDAEDADFAGLMSSEPAIGGPSVIAGDLQGDSDQGLGAMAPLHESEPGFEEMNRMDSLDLGGEFQELSVSEVQTQDGNPNWLEFCLDNLLYQDPQERNEFQNFPVNPVALCFDEIALGLDPPKTEQFQTITDPVSTHLRNSAPCLYIKNAYESTPNEVRSRTDDQVLQSFPDPMETHFIPASHQVEILNPQGDQYEHPDFDIFLTCSICGNNPNLRIVSSCLHAICQQYYQDSSSWLQGKGQICPNCWIDAGQVLVDANASQVFGPEVEFGRNMEYRTDHEHAQNLIIHQGYQPGLTPAQHLDLIGYDAQELNQAVQDLIVEYQPVLHFDATLCSEAVPGWEPSATLIDLPEPIPSTSKQSKQRHGCRKRRRDPRPLVVDHDGVSMRYDGCEERFTSYYRPSYWTEDDSSVFLGEYPTFDEAVDAYNLVALLHDEEYARLILPYTANRYTDELKRWEGKHHVDLVCELRLRGRGLLKDGTVNYKHVGRRWSGKKKDNRYFSTVSDNLVSSCNAKTGKTKGNYLTTFDTPEQAARYADQVLVRRKGPEAWTNFPLSSYITSEDELPLSYLPISNNFRDNLTYKRTKA